MSWNQDAAGLSHYVFDGIGIIYGAIEDALSTRPITPAWFWFNGTPCPMHSDDDRAAVYHRWSNWREAFQRGDLIKKLQDARGSDR